jgi:uncharacterized membrane protein YfcA
LVFLDIPMLLYTLLFFGLYAATGAIAGLLAGLLGVGGGLIIVPLLTAIFEAQGLHSAAIIHLALGTSLASIVFTSLSSTRAHHSRKAVDFGLVKRLTPGILVGTFLGGVLAATLSTAWLKGVFAVFLFTVAVQMFSGARPHPTRTLPGTLGLTAVGLAIGGVSGLVGIGGGSLSVPFMVFCNVEMRRTIGTSAAIGFPIAIAGACSYVINGLVASTGVPYTLGYLHLPALAGVALLSVLTAPLGARLTATLPPARIKRGFACLLAVMAIKMLWGVLTK